MSDEVVGDVPERIWIAARMCTRVQIVHMAGVRSLQLFYDENPEPCGRCLLCTLKAQLPANDISPLRDERGSKEGGD